MLWVLVLTFSLSFSAQSQVSFDEYYHERSIFYQNEVDTEDPDTYPKKFARIQYFHEDRACDDQSSEMTLLPMHNSYKHLNETANQWKVAYEGIDVTWEALGPFEATNQSLGRIDAVSTPLSGPEHMQTILIGTPSSGIFKTVNGGQTWQCVTDTDDFYSPGLGCQHILHDVENNDHVYAAIGVNTLHPLNETGDGYGLGIYKSTDGGDSWVATELEFIPSDRQLITRIIQNPNNPDQMYASSWDKVYRTNDKWFSYDVIFEPSSTSGLNQSWCYGKKLIIDLDADPFDWNHIIISSTGVEGWVVSDTSADCYYPEDTYHPAEIHETFNAQSSNVTWDYLDAVWPNTNFTYIDQEDEDYDPDDNPPHFCVVEFSHVTQGTVFVASQNFFDPQTRTRVFKKNQGSQFFPYHQTGSTITPKNNKYQYQFKLSPTDDDVFYLGGWNLYRYFHGNEDYILASPVVNPFYHVDTRSLMITHSSQPSAQGENDVILAGNDGGISLCTFPNNQATAQNINGYGLNITQFYGMDLTNRKENVKFTAGAHDGNTCHWNGSAFEHFFSGDDYKMVLSYQDFDLGLFFNQNSLKRLISEGSGFTSASPPNNDNNNNNYRWDPPILRHPQDPQSFLMGYNNVWQRTGGTTGSWTQLSDFQADFGLSGNLRAIAVSATNPDYMLAGFIGATWSVDAQDKLFFTHDGGNNWHDITTAIDGFVNTAGISDLIFDEMNPHEFYVAFNGFRDDQNNPDKRIVKCSIPSVNNLAGITTVDISNGLPNCPVNVLKWVSGSNRLLLGNDVGVFIYDENQWNYLGDGLPVTVVSDIAIDYHNKDIYITTFGRGFWRASLPCDLDLDGDITLTNDTHWNFDGLLLERNVIVPDGVTLTVSEQVNFSANVGIKVMPGGKLVLTEGANLTSACDELWLGVEVWGNADLSQSPTTNQGQLVSNGGTIQDAHTAIWVRENDEVCNYVDGTGGGIVQLTNTTIRNCYVGVEFAPYRWHLANDITASNKSYFNVVTFEQTKPLLGGFLFKSHAILEDVVKIRFRGCTFIDYVANEPEYMNLYGINGGEMGVGIDSRSASFMVQPWCTGVLDAEGNDECLNGTWVEPTFTNLRYGVLAGSFFTNEPFSVRGALFNDNLVGIKAYGNDIGPAIVQNTFHVTPRPVSSLTGVLADASVGVLMRGVRGFEVEENEFLGIPDSNFPDIRLIGSAFHWTGTNSNECYKNQFDNLDAGALALGINGLWVGTTLDGLEFKCNEFGQNAVNTYGDIVVGDNSSVRRYQGQDQSGRQAGNLFSHLCPSGGEPSDIVMGVDAMNITYWYGTGDPAERPLCFTTSLVSDEEVDGTNTCTSKLSKDASKVVLLDDIENVNGILIDTKNLYIGLLDCGSSQDVLDAINNPQLSSMEVRNAMLNCSPYISDTVFTAAFNRIPALSPWHMAQVLLSNSPFSPAVKQMMYDANFDPYYEQLVLNGQNGGPTHKTILESDIAYLQGELSRMRQDYLRLALLWDEDEADWGEALARLQADSADVVTYIGALINTGDLIQADSELLSLPKSSDEEKAIYAILRSRIDGTHCPRFSPTELAVLQSVADDPDSPISARAYAALMPVTGEVVDIPLPFPSSKRMAQQFYPEVESTPFLKLFPNPANDVVNLVFKAPDPDTRCRFVLEDNQGRRVLELNDIRNGIAEFSVNRLPGGMYFGRLIFDNTVISTEKITVVR